MSIASLMHFRASEISGSREQVLKEMFSGAQLLFRGNGTLKELGDGRGQCSRPA